MDTKRRIMLINASDMRLFDSLTSTDRRGAASGFGPKEGKDALDTQQFELLVVDSLAEGMRRSLRVGILQNGLTNLSLVQHVREIEMSVGHFASR